MIQVYTGNGKGKTTAALGLCLRALGAGRKVLLIQFLKQGDSSEIKAIRKHLSFLKTKAFGRKSFLDRNTLTKEDFSLARQGFNFFKKAVDDYEIIVLDEINVALDLGLIDDREFFDFLKSRRKDNEIILTGRKAPEKLIQLADLVTEAKEIKHYFNKKIKAREGIEY